MDFKAKDYYEAGRERLAQAELLFTLPDEHCKGLEGRRYALVVYTAGLAVECMLRAYRLKGNSQFDSRHRLAELFVESGLDTHVEAHLVARGHDADSEVVIGRLTRLRAAVDVAAGVWRNSHRFASDAMLCRDLLARRILSKKDNKGPKAKVLQRQAHRLLLSAKVVIKAGEDAWT